MLRILQNKLEPKAPFYCFSSLNNRYVLSKHDLLFFSIHIKVVASWLIIVEHKEIIYQQ